MATAVPIPGRVASFPASVASLENPYWRLLRGALEQRGVEFDDHAVFRAEWLWANRGRTSVLHFHFIQDAYAFEAVYARRDWVLRFARNLLLARALGYRTVFTLHNLTPDYPLRPSWVDYLGHWCAINLTSAVIVHCEYARHQVAERFGRRSRVYVMPHPSFGAAYPNEVQRSDARAQLGLADDELVFAHVGGLRKNKGVDALLRAFARLPGEKLRLVVAAKPWPPLEYAASISEMAAADPRVQVHLREIPDDEMQVFLNAADAVVLPFQSILTSGSAILAMSFGKPVVVPALGCLPELVTPDVGILYEANNDESLLQALRRCQTVELSALGERARRKAEKLSWGSLADQTLAVYGGTPAAKSSYARGQTQDACHGSLQGVERA